VLPGDFIGAFPAPTMTQEEISVGEGFEEKSAKLLRRSHFIVSGREQSHPINCRLCLIFALKKMAKGISRHS
jgi:hypothetical protein